MQSFSIPTTNVSFSSDSRRKEEPTEPREVVPCPLTRSTLLLTQALSAAHSAPDIRENKVAAIKARLAAGTYEVNSLRIAEALVNENPNLFSRF